MPGNGSSWGINVSEGGLEPPCPLRALAPQASASAYSATRTRDAWGTHRLSYLSKPNVSRRGPRPVNLATRGVASRLIIPSPAPGTFRRHFIPHGCRVDVVPARWRLAKSIIGGLPGRPLASLLVPVCPQPTPVTADPRPLSRHPPFIRRGCLVRVAVTAWMWHSYHLPPTRMVPQ